MIFPSLPLDTSARQLLDFCLKFRTMAGFIAVYEMKKTQLKKKRRNDGVSGMAYEATEILHVELFGRRRYEDREVFYNALARYRRDKGK